MACPEQQTRYRLTTPPRRGMFAVASSEELLRENVTKYFCGDLEFCDPGISQAVTAIPGVVIADHMDGRVLWESNTLREYETVSGGIGRGGSFGGGGPMMADGMLYVNAGYGINFHMPGNVMRAFGIADDIAR
jgi:polyvinyl alcohol dehydrogenase (cytochrome)